MGKKDFNSIVESAHRARGGELSIKISSFSHRYRSNGCFAGLIVYYKDGKFEWQQESCAATHNYRGKSFYVVIQDTAQWPAAREQRARGQGLVHDYILKHNIGINHDTEGYRVCCGGFAIIQGEVKYSSVWLNMTDGYCNGMSWSSDGSKYMSQLEQHFVDIAIREWKIHGPNHTIPLRKVNGRWQTSAARSIERCVIS